LCIEFFDIDGNLIKSYSSPSFEGMTEDEIFDLPCWRDKEKARKLWGKLKKSFEDLENGKKENKN